MKILFDTDYDGTRVKIQNFGIVLENKLFVSQDEAAIWLVEWFKENYWQA